MKSTKIWQLQEAKNKLSQVVDAAIEQGPQTITRHGQAVAIILSIIEYKNSLQPKQSLVDVLSQLRGSNLKIDRAKKLTRDIHL